MAFEGEGPSGGWPSLLVFEDTDITLFRAANHSEHTLTDSACSDNSAREPKREMQQCGSMEIASGFCKAAVYFPQRISRNRRSWNMLFGFSGAVGDSFQHKYLEESFLFGTNKTGSTFTW